MNANSLDAIARAIARTVPRRAALGGCLATAFAAVLVRFGPEDAAAKNRGKRRRRRRKRCLKLFQVCTPGGKRCCGDLRCDRFDFVFRNFQCCKGEGKPCSVTEPSGCCDKLECALVGGGNPACVPA